jgi:hypothetical protein
MAVMMSQEIDPQINVCVDEHGNDGNNGTDCKMHQFVDTRMYFYRFVLLRFFFFPTFLKI